MHRLRHASRHFMVYNRGQFGSLGTTFRRQAWVEQRLMSGDLSCQPETTGLGGECSEGARTLCSSILYSDALKP